MIPAATSPSGPRLTNDAADIILGGPRKQRHSDESDVSANPSSDKREKAEKGQTPQAFVKKPDADDSNQKPTESGTGSAPARTPKDSEEKPPASQPTDAHPPTETNEFGATFQEVPLELISPNPKQPRDTFEPEALAELAHSIKEFGLLQPIVVRPVGGRYELIMGERRWRASQQAGLDAIPAIVRETEEEHLLRDALLENIHRVQLTPLEEAAAYQQLLEEFGVTQAELADRLGRSRPVITNTIRLLQLPVPVQRRVAAGVLSAGHARALLGLKTGTADQEHLAARIVQEGLSVRATEEAVTLLNNGAGRIQRAKRTPAAQPPQLGTFANRLSDAFDTKVSVTMGKKKGKIVLEFGDLSDLDRLMDLLGQPADDTN